MLRFSDDEAYLAFKALRWVGNDGSLSVRNAGAWSLQSARRKMWRCKDCGWQFSVTSGTIFASRNLAIRDILAAIAFFVNGAKGHSAAISARPRRTIQNRFRAFA